MKNIQYILAAILFLAFASCEEEDKGPSDKTLPVIQKIAPQYAHQAYDFGDTAYFKINFSDNVQLKTVSLKLYLETDSVVLFHQFSPEASTASIDTFILMNDPLFSELNFDITAIDASGNVAKQSSHIHLR